MLKRFFDIVASAIGLISLAPIFLLIGLLVRVNLGAPVFFVQERPGLNGVPFKMIKFRTMKDLIGGNGERLPDGDRLTGFGRLLRSTSLDELPGLWSVLKGDMALIGPRPLLMEYIPLYNSEQNRRHDVRPGITGWAQVNGRNAISWEEKFAADLWYVDNQSLMLDFKILAMTIIKVLKRDGIDADGEATMSKFTGS
ncbi:MAG: sugar transferase [Parasphingorhabdus sp.]|uniref:sugar transferase n=1 Tax=Parasphingorhabdus sp. TaxID=2709688 RepID=UPI003297153D